MFTEQDKRWMTATLELAATAARCSEVPVGALIVFQQDVIARAHNQPITRHDPTAHAEILAIRQAAQRLQNYRLVQSTLYVSLEPCAMCVGAIIQARIARVVVAAPDPKTGACGGCCDLLQAPYHNHKVEYSSGLMVASSAALLREFFQARRKK
jgi:tRNA(adenine34) deaminase